MNFSKNSINRRISELKSPKKRLGHRAGSITLGTIAGITVFIAVTGLSFGYGAIRGILAESPVYDPSMMKPTEYFSSIYNSHGEVVQQLIGPESNRIRVTYDELPADLVNAFVAIEDSRFWQHRGIDIRSILRAVTGVLSDNYSGGGSTITQQLIKNTVFNGGAEKNAGSRFERKVQEQYLALKLTHDVDRKTILTNYLNTINLGNDTLGVEAASRRYFGKDVSQLNLSECAVIAGITQNPARYNPITHPQDNASRREIVLSEMYRQGYITAQQRDEALEDDVYVRIQTNDIASRSESHPYSWYTDELIEQVTGDLKKNYGYTDTQAWNLLYTGGLQIYTPQDPDIQKIVDEEVNDPSNYSAAKISLDYRLSVSETDGTIKNYTQDDIRTYIRTQKEKPDFDGLFATEAEANTARDEFRARALSDGGTILSETSDTVIQPQVSFVLMDQNTGEVKALSGGRGEKKASRILNRAADSLRQPGSTFKVLSVFAPALDSGQATLATTYYDAPLSSDGKIFHNWWGDDYKGYHTIREAITYSMNIPAVLCLRDTVKPQNGVEFARNLGISTLTATDNNLATALGGITNGVSNLELTNAFASIADGGVYRKPVFYTKVTDQNGKILLDGTPEATRVMKDSTAFLLTNAMTDVMKSNTLYDGGGYPVHSTGTTAAFDGMTIAGKSGTTTRNNDVWFVGYTPYYTAGIWGGCDGNQSLSNSETGVNNGGTSFHKIIWRKIMQRVHQGMTDPGFAVPSDIETADVCRKSGKLPITGVCENDPRGSSVYTEYFAAGTVPTEVCDHHVRITVCGASGMRPTSRCPESGLTQKVIMTVPDGGDVTDDSAFAMPDYCSIHSPD
ncbi:penicillin-binding protein 1A [[Clostridium] aminophilum]|uniref:Penicillin-binding protein 1A n=1 Tax=[Clostridium] aminophilum TaxID=1526 RepID=A0A1I0B832_9FIRM|nr:transglycosylase domain-containing protein [[Clostridium] aminophilum]SET02877.1 penicillin-binding protein 1A [[Clostridium] aminophilum]